MVSINRMKDHSLVNCVVWAKQHDRPKRLHGKNVVMNVRRVNNLVPTVDANPVHVEHSEHKAYSRLVQVVQLVELHRKLAHRPLKNARYRCVRREHT